MEVITGHYGADFDCLAAIVAAGKLFPRALRALPPRAHRNVRDFLSLYEDAFDLQPLAEVEPEKITRLILVDTKQVAPLGPLAKAALRPEVEVLVYDHHTLSSCDIPHARVVEEEIGATTTLLVREIRQQGIELTPVEATVMALGIYEDTGSLTFSTTTPEDLRCAGFLVEQGANLDVVSRFVRYAITSEQREVFNQFILSAQHYSVHGVRVAIAHARVEEYLGDIASLTQKLILSESVEAVFTLTAMRGSIYIVGRSRSDAVDVAQILSVFGGRGHHRAASAIVREGDVARCRARLLEQLRQTIKPPLTARDIMSRPVRMIEQERSINDAWRLLVRYGYTGMPVVAEGKLVGLISRRDVDRARQHNLGHAPVKAYMSRNVVTATPDTPVPELENLLLTHNVGRVPIVDGEAVVGIVSRADLRRGVHGAEPRHETFRAQWSTQENLAQLMRERLPEEVLARLKMFGEVGDELNMPVFLVGGAVRDFLLNIPNFDIDLLVEGDGIAYARKLGERLSARVVAHEKFGTAVLILPDGEKIDVATARTEFYAHPAALPAVEHASVKEDLYRRDFTINAMALQLNGRRFGTILDFFGGRADLEDKIIRVLHNLSFVEDPTRMFRAVRFEQRYGFRLDRHTESLLLNAVESHVIDNLTAERIRDELILMLQEDSAVAAIHRMAHLGLLEALDEKLTFGPEVLEELRRTKSIIEWWAGLGRPRDNCWALYLFPLLVEMSPAEVREFARRFRFSREVTEILALGAEAEQATLSALSGARDVRPSEIYELLRELPVEVVLRLIVCAGQGSVEEQRLKLFLTKLREVKLAVGGEDLIALGYTPGPQFGRVLTLLRNELLDRGEMSAEEQRARLRALAQEIIGPPPSSASR